LDFASDGIAGLVLPDRAPSDMSREAGLNDMNSRICRRGSTRLKGLGKRCHVEHVNDMIGWRSLAGGLVLPVLLCLAFFGSSPISSEGLD